MVHTLSLFIGSPYLISGYYHTHAVQCFIGIKNCEAHLKHSLCFGSFNLISNVANEETLNIIIRSIVYPQVNWCYNHTSLPATLCGLLMFTVCTTSHTLRFMQRKLQCTVLVCITYGTNTDLRRMCVYTRMSACGRVWACVFVCLIRYF